MRKLFRRPKREQKEEVGESSTIGFRSSGSPAALATTTNRGLATTATTVPTVTTEASTGTAIATATNSSLNPTTELYSTQGDTGMKVVADSANATLEYVWPLIFS